MDGGEGGDNMNQFHRNEAISAVSDDGFLGEEDEDYEDLYNDVNVSEGFFQALKKNDDLGNGGDRSDNNKAGGGVGVGASASIPGVVGGGDSGAAYGNQGFRGGDDGGKVPPGGSGTGGVGGLRVELGNSSSKIMMEKSVNDNVDLGGGGGIGQQLHVGGVGSAGNEGLLRQGAGGNGNGNGFNAAGSGMVGNGTGSGVVVAAGTAVGTGNGGGGTTLFVGDLHWWTTDAQVEAECCKYGPVKEVKFFEEKASGKSKGYCQVDFYDPAAATACKDGMHGYLFNGRPCVVAFASPHSIRRMGDAQANRGQQVGLAKKGPNDAVGKPTGSSIPTGGNFQGADNNRGYGRGNWGRGGGQGMGNRGAPGGMRNRGGGMGGRGIMGNGGNGFGGAPPMMHPQAMMGQGFDPAFGGPMGRMGNYGGFPGGPAPPFSGMLPSYPPMGGMPGAAPHVNPAFFGRGMPMGGMGMMPGGGVDGPNMGMWSDPSMGGWGGDEHGGGRVAESSYGEETASDHQPGDVNHERGGWQGSTKEKDKAFERDWSGSSERRHRDDREPGHDRNLPRERDGHDHDVSEKRHPDERDSGRERDRERERDIGRSRDRDRAHSRDRERGHDRVRDREKERERYSDHHRHKDRKSEHDDEWDGGRSSRNYGKPRLSQDDYRSRSRDGDYDKRRRLTSE